MPFRVRYVLRRGFPRRLEYRGGTIALEIVRQSLGGDGVWQLRAKKITPSETCLLAESRLGRYGFATVIFTEGFVLDGASPAGKIMARLESEGHAIGRPERVRAEWSSSHRRRSSVPPLPALAGERELQTFERLIRLPRLR